MKTLLKLFLIIFLIGSFPVAAYSQEELYNKLNSRLAKLFKSRDYDEAIKVAEQIVDVAKKTYGEKHPFVSVSLNNMGLLHMARKEYTKAVSVYEKSLKMAEELLGKKNQNLVSILTQLVKCCNELGEYEKSGKYQERIDEIEG